MFQLCMCALGLMLLAAMVSRQAQRHFFGLVGSQVRTEMLLTAILISVLLFGFAYHTIALAEPGQFIDLHTRLDALYFSLSTVTTAGSGAIQPNGQLARAFVAGQMIFDMAIVALALAVISGRLQGRKVRREANGGLTGVTPPYGRLARSRTMTATELQPCGNGPARTPQQNRQDSAG